MVLRSLGIGEAVRSRLGITRDVRRLIRREIRPFLGRKGRLRIRVRLDDRTDTKATVIRILRAEIRKRTPIRTGRLRRSLTVKARGTQYEIRYLVNYASYVYNLHKGRGNDYIRDGVAATEVRLLKRRARGAGRGNKRQR